jgi:photosystem II stability/assembly factor-like uncharacterized protein
LWSLNATLALVALLLAAALLPQLSDATTSASPAPAAAGTPVPLSERGGSDAAAKSIARDDSVASQDASRGTGFDASTSLATPLVSTPGVALETVPAGDEVLGGSFTLMATGTDLPAGNATYVFESEEAEPEPGSPGPTWTPIESTPTEDIAFVSGLLDGLYNFRVTVTVEGEGHTYKYTSELDDLLKDAEGPSPVRLKAPAPYIRGTTGLVAQVPQDIANADVESVEFQWKPSNDPPGNTGWTTIGAAVPVPQKSGQTEVQTGFNTATVPDGSYDFRVVPQYKSEEAHPTIPRRGILIDNTPPTVRIAPPGTSLKGNATLDAEAGDPPPQTGEPSSGVATVTFQDRPETATGSWTTIGTTTHVVESNSNFPLAAALYARTLDTESLPNGSYEFRATAEDRVGNVTVSEPVRGIAIANTGTAAEVSASLSGVTAPAERVRFLGTVAATAGHEAETWAYGFTSAPAAEVDGKRLEYTAEGQQPILLRYTAGEGWQVREVPERRESDGSLKAFKLLKRDEVEERPEQNEVKIGGMMTRSGEAWLWIAEPSRTNTEEYELFHRKAGPGQPFVYDEEGSSTLKELLGGVAENAKLSLSLKLGESAQGDQYGMLISPEQPRTEAPEGSHQFEQVKYGLLENGKWTLKEASLPPALLGTTQPMRLTVGEVSGAGEGWATFQTNSAEKGRGLVLGRFKAGVWKFSRVGNNALDLTGPDANSEYIVTPVALKASGSDVWVEAEVGAKGKLAKVVALLSEQEGAAYALTTRRSWCSLAGSPAVEFSSCDEPLGDAAVPVAIFRPNGEPVEGGTAEGETVALALQTSGTAGSYVAVYEHGAWREVLAPGDNELKAEEESNPTALADFSGPNEGWLAGKEALSQWSGEGATPLASWPVPDRAPLTSAALPAGESGGAGEAGALAVGFKGTALSFDPVLGWQVNPVPARARHVNLLSVAFAGSENAFAVGQFGTILRWNGSSWSEDPQSTVVTGSQLNAVSFGESTTEGFAVGTGGTILHYDGSRWNTEEPPLEDAGANITSVAVSGSEAFAVAGGNLITHRSDGVWEPASWSATAQPPKESLRTVAALGDGGVVVAGRSIVLFRQRAGMQFEPAPQPLQGLVVALAPFREANGKLRTFASLAPSADARNGTPPGDGDVLRESEDGWQDLSHAQYAGSEISGDGAVKPDPVLAIATGSTGEHLWAVGGYAGTPDSAGRGTEQPLATRAETWQTAVVSRYDTGGSAQPTSSAASSAPALQAEPGTVSFAFFTSPMCKEECAAVPDAQPDVNLRAAAGEIATYAQEADGPAFAMLGGNAVGPVEATSYEAGVNAVSDFSHLSEELAPLGDLPTFAAPGAFDRVPKQPAGDALRPWAEAFAGAPPPFGSGPAAPGITPAGPSGATEHEAHRYYAFNASQNGGTLRVIVLDDSASSELESAQREWLERQLEGAGGEGLPVVVVAASPLRKNLNREPIAELITEPRWNGEVLAVFSTDGSLPRPAKAGELHELNEVHLIPQERPEGSGQRIPDYEGATLGYQQSENDGVAWYLASINTQARTVGLQAVPVIESLDLKPVDGLNVARSHTLQFEAIARRPPSTLATKATETSPFEGYDDYLQIPASCGKGRPCIKPSYEFTSSVPAIGTFVEATSVGSPYPKYNNGKATIASASSSLFCAYNPGTTVVTITAGLLSYSETVTVEPGDVGEPCGTRPPPNGGSRNRQLTTQTAAGNGGAATPAPPPTALSGVNPVLTAVPPPPAPVTHVTPAAPTPAPVEPVSQVPAEQVPLTPAIVPATTPPVEPIPPGSGGYAQSPSAAERKEKARKHASQSAFVIRPAGTTGEDWFYGAVALSTLLALMLSAAGLRAGPRARPALVYNRTPTDKRKQMRR